MGSELACNFSFVFCAFDNGPEQTMMMTMPMMTTMVTTMMTTTMPTTMLTTPVMTTTTVTTMLTTTTMVSYSAQASLYCSRIATAIGWALASPASTSALARSVPLEPQQRTTRRPPPFF